MIDDPPLKGLRVLDLAQGAMAGIGRQLADLGADVVRIEPRAGAVDRRQGLMVGSVSLNFVAANRGKASVACDLEESYDREVFETLLSSADILIESTRPESKDSRVLDVADIGRRYPRLVILSASDFGVESPLRNWVATDPVMHALSGNLSRSGLPGRTPLLPPGNIGTEAACAQAVFVILVAYINRMKSGLGDHLDFSVFDGACHALDPGFGMSGTAAVGVPANRLPRGRPAVQFMYPIIACRDGFVRLCVLAARQWRAMFEWMGRPAEFADPAFDTLKGRFSSPTLIPRMSEFLADKTRAEIEGEAERRGVPVAAVLAVDELMQTAQVEHRKLFADIEIAPGVSAPILDGLLEIDGHRASAAGGVSLLDADRESVISRWARPRVDTSAWEHPGERPLAGIRVLDLGVIVVGAEQARLLADQGADVIKVENAAYPDGTRQISDANSVAITFAAGHRNKRGLGLNLRQAEGRQLFLELIRQCDIVAANFKPGTMESLGLGYETLRAANPRLILVNSSAYGSTGPWSSRLGYGPLVRASAGMTLQWRYTDDPGSFSDASTIYPDHVAGRVGAIGALALLIRRARTGRGGTVDVAQMDVMLSHMTPQIAANVLRNRGIEVEVAGVKDTPWGVFPACGEDEWCVVTVRNDSEWRQLCEVMDRADLLQDAMLTTATGRAAQRQRIDDAVSAWLVERPPFEAMAALQSAGVPAGAMLRVNELPDFQHFVERSFFRTETHPTIAEAFLLEAAPVRSTRLPDPPSAPAPLAGEHTRDIARTLLKLTDTEIDRLIQDKVLEARDPITKDVLHPVREN